MGKSKHIPDRWLKYKPVGAQIEGTRFIAFKVPLNEKANEIVRDEEKRLDCEQLMRLIPNLGLIIDLTNTNRYYSSKCFVDKGLKYTKIFTEGHVVPSKKVLDKFKASVNTFLNDNKDNDKLIGVHCTHGVNRTGYMICNYMITVMSLSSEIAIKKFAEARGHNIERENYIDNLVQLDPVTQKMTVVGTTSVNSEETNNLNNQYKNNEHNNNIASDWRCRERATACHHNMTSVNAEGTSNLFNYNNNYYNDEHNNNFISNWRNRSQNHTQRYGARNEYFQENTWSNDYKFNFNNNNRTAVDTHFSSNITRNYRAQPWNVLSHFENRRSNRSIKPRSERFANYNHNSN